jgi:hypothetical protein
VSFPCSIVGRSPVCGWPLVRVSAVYCLLLGPSQYSIHPNQCGLFSFLLLKTISFSAVAAGVNGLRNRQVFSFCIRNFCVRISSLLFLFLFPLRLSLNFLRYKPKGRRFDFQRCHWNFSLSYSFRPHYDPGVESTSNRNEYQECSLGVKAAGA